MPSHPCFTGPGQLCYISNMSNPTLAAGEAVPREYDEAIKWLHWVVLALLTGQYLIAWTMPHVGRGTRPVGLVGAHLALGTLILLLMVVRLVLRWATPTPPPPSDLSVPLQIISRANQVLLYTIVIALPVMGWINASARGWQVWLGGFIPLPSLSPVGDSGGMRMGDLHAALGTLLLYVIGAHVCGAIYHISKRDGVAGRMLPRA
jgi:cytochrome b561